MLATTAQMYTYVLNGLDKAAATTVSPSEFEVMINASMLDWVKQRYRRLEKDERAMDDLRVLTSDPLIIANTGATVAGQEVFQLPYVQTVTPGVGHGYLFALNMALMLLDPVTQLPVPCRSVDGWASARPLPRDIRYSIRRNAFWKPTDKEPYYNFVGNAVHVVTGGAYTSAIRLEYLRHPIDLHLSPTIDPELPVHVNQEICDMCIRKHLEEIESPRWQTNAREDQLKN